MSAPSTAERDAEYLNYGFLSVKAGNAIRTRLEGDPISADDKEILMRADELLRQISSGAEIATSGHAQSNDVDPSASVRALDLAQNPIRHVQGQVQLHQLAGLFTSMADAVEKCAASTVTPSKSQTKVLIMAAQFFDALYECATAALDHRGMSSFSSNQIDDLISTQ